MKKKPIVCPHCGVEYKEQELVEKKLYTCDKCKGIFKLNTPSFFKRIFNKNIENTVKMYEYWTKGDDFEQHFFSTHQNY